MTRRIQLSDTTLADTTHALRGAPLTQEEILSLAGPLDEAGFHAVEVWGGSTFDLCLRLLHENPWERLRAMAGKMKRTPLRIIVRGQNLLGYRPQPLDVIQAFAEETAACGVRMARIHDPLNDPDNLGPVIDAFNRVGIETQGSIIYTQSPVHTMATFRDYARRLAAMGCARLCVSDIAGILTPHLARDLVREIAAFAPVSVHIRSVSGMGALASVAALEAGAEGVDCALGPFSVATAQSSPEAVLEALVGGELETGIDRRALKACTRNAERIAVRHAGSAEDTALLQNIISVHKIPFGMLSGLVAELRGINAMDRLPEILAEATRVREDFGWPPLISPVSQMVAELAIQNVVSGRRYGVVSREARDYLRGVYGAPPGAVNDALGGDLVRVTGRSALLLPPRMEPIETELVNLGVFRAREDVLTFALFGAAALPFLRDRGRTKSRLASNAPDRRLEFLTAFMERRRLRRLEVAEKDFQVRLVKRGPAPPAPAIQPFAPTAESPSAPPPAAIPSGPVVRSPLGGTFYRSSGPGQPVFAAEGAEVTAETVIGLVEAMKLFHEVKAGVVGTIERFEAADGGTVEEGSAICRLRGPA